MHGLVNRSIQRFIEDVHGPDIWDAIAAVSKLEEREFESMLDYPDELTEHVLNATAKVIDKDVNGALEDLGTFLVANPDQEAVRRLLRFSGPTFDDFLISLHDLPDRVRLVMPDIDLPDIGFESYAENSHSVIVEGKHRGYSAVLTGILRAMADEYGVLVLLDRYSCLEDGKIKDRIRIDVIADDLLGQKEFTLTAPGAE